MVLHRNHLPKKLVGAHGVRLLNFPGLTYPNNVLHDSPPVHIADSIPPWGISTADAAHILGCANSTARTLLHQFEVRKQKVRRPKLAPTWYWDKYQVEAIAAARCKEIRAIPPHLLCSKQVCALLRISRSTLTRYVQCGLLKASVYRQRLEHATCSPHLFLLSDVVNLHYHMTAIKHKFALDTLEPSDLPPPSAPSVPETPAPH